MKILKFRKIDSTNNYAKKLALSGEKEKTVILAKEQTAGRGRLGRTFLSKRGGLYFSVILRPNIKTENVIFITVAAAVAISKAIESISTKKCKIKWVNDIYIDEKKVCGILTEGNFNKDGMTEFVILGIGINLFSPKGGFPDYLPLAGSIFDKKINFFKNFIKKKLLKKFLNEFFKIYYDLENKEFINEYRQRSFLSGKKIIYKKDDENINATVIEIDENARLVVKRGNIEESLSHGEVQIVGMEQLEI